MSLPLLLFSSYTTPSPTTPPSQPYINFLVSRPDLRMPYKPRLFILGDSGSSSSSLFASLSSLSFSSPLNNNGAHGHDHETSPSRYAPPRSPPLLFLETLRRVSSTVKRVVDEHRSKLKRNLGGIEIFLDDAGALVIQLYQLILPYKTLPDFCSALAGIAISSIIRPSLEISEMSFCDSDYTIVDSELLALNEVVPPSILLSFNCDLTRVSFTTLLAVMEKRGLDIAWSTLPKWEIPPAEAHEARGFLQIFLERDDDFVDNQSCICPLMSRVAEISWAFNTVDPCPEEIDMLVRAAETAKSIDITGAFDRILPLIAKVPRLNCYNDPLDLTTRGVRALVEAYLVNDREVYAELWADADNFRALASGFTENTLVTEDQLRGRNDHCLAGDSYVFTSRRMSVRVFASRPVNGGLEYQIIASFGLWW